MNITIAGVTDAGRVRDNNEDRIGWNEESGLVVLADGMGGHQAGEVASELAVTRVMAAVQGTLLMEGSVSPDQAQSLLQDAVQQANNAIYEAAQQDAGRQGMGTTLVAAFFDEAGVTIANVGDSRLYRLRNGELERLTVDHSLVEEMIAKGILTPEEARCSNQRNIITRALGMNDTVEVDILRKPLSHEDLYLLCSDGLSDVLDDEVIQAMLLEGNNLSQLAQTLVERANALGGPDNISVILVKLEG